MRAPDKHTRYMCGYLSLDQRVRQDNPLRAIRRMTTTCFASLSGPLHEDVLGLGGTSIPPGNCRARCRFSICARPAATFDVC